MSANDNLKAVAAAYEGFQRDDWGPLFSILADDFVFTNYEGNPFAGTYHGRAGFEHVEKVLEGADMSKFEVETMVADDDTVIAVVDIEYTVKATGKSNPPGPTVHIMDFQDGKMTRFRDVSAHDGGAWER